MSSTKEYSDEVIYQARLIVARAKFWTPDTEKLLRRWKKQIRQRYQGHKNRESHFWYWLYGLALVVISLQVINAVLAFSNSGGDGGTTVNLNVNGTNFTAYLEPPSNVTALLIAGILSSIAAGMSAFATFMDPGGSRKAHKDASSDCDILSREIDDILNRQIPQRGDPVAEIQKIRNKFDILVQNSPSVPEKFRTGLDYATFEKKRSKGMSYDHSKVVRPPPSNLDFNSLRKRNRTVPDASVLANILVKDMKEAEKLKEDIQKANDYDTEDEDREVTLHFDPESFRPDDILEDENTRLVRESLQKAMNFELSRFGEEIYDSSKKVSTRTPRVQNHSETQTEEKGSGSNDSLPEGQEVPEEIIIDIYQESPVDKDKDEDDNVLHIVEDLSSPKHIIKGDPLDI